jgi:glutaredoxin-related protein
VNKEFLYDYQKEAVEKMKNGCILNGGVGSGKSRTALYYYFQKQGGSITTSYKPMKKNPKNLYIITTARKRDTLEWEGELVPYLMTSLDTNEHYYNHKVIIDSWNNIKKYQEIKDAFFIFDEQRVVGYGAWTKNFLKITKNNEWILLSATPGDTWSDYIPVFIANGFYKNKSEFIREHVIFARYTKYPKIDRYVNTKRLIRQRNDILINMDFIRTTIYHHIDIFTLYDREKYKEAIKTRWNPYKNLPMQQASELCYVLRRIVNESDSRLVSLLEILDNCNKAIIFYNFDYELEMLLSLKKCTDYEIAEWNGHKHQEIPDSEKWLYLVQYAAGAEGWNCIKTDTIIFFSQNYSYKTMEQACGRINRLNTPYKDLYYYHLKTNSSIDLAISRALKEKKNFNEGKFIKWN